MIRFPIIITALALAACGHASAANGELQCQQRIADARKADADIKTDPFGAAAYAKLDKAGCSAEQLADITKLRDDGAALAVLSQANEDAAATGNEDKHMVAFQKFNDALIAFSELQQATVTKLEKMKAEAAQ